MAEKRYFDPESGQEFTEYELGVYQRQRQRLKDKAYAESPEGQRAVEEAEATARGAGIRAGMGATPGAGVAPYIAEAIAGIPTALGSMGTAFGSGLVGVAELANIAEARRRGDTGPGLPPGTVASDRALPGGIPFKPEIAKKLAHLQAKGVDVDHLIESGQIGSLEDFGDGVREPEVKRGDLPEMELEEPAVVDAGAAAYMRNPRLAALKRGQEERREAVGEVQQMLGKTYFTTGEGGQAAKMAGGVLPIAAGAVVAPQAVIPALAGAIGTHAAMAPVGERLAAAAGETPEEQAAFGEEFGTVMSFGPGMVGGHMAGAALAKRIPALQGKPLNALQALRARRRAADIEGAHGEARTDALVRRVEEKAWAEEAANQARAAQERQMALDVIEGRGPEGTLTPEMQARMTAAVEAPAPAARGGIGRSVIRAGTKAMTYPLLGAVSAKTGIPIPFVARFLISDQAARYAPGLVARLRNKLPSFLGGKKDIRGMNAGEIWNTLSAEQRNAFLKDISQTEAQAMDAAFNRTKMTDALTSVADEMAQEAGGLTSAETAKFNRLVEMLKERATPNAEKVARERIIGEREVAPEGPEQLSLTFDQPVRAPETPAPGLQGRAGEALRARTTQEPTPAPETPPAAPEAPAAPTPGKAVGAGKAGEALAERAPTQTKRQVWEAAGYKVSKRKGKKGYEVTNPDGTTVLKANKTEAEGYAHTEALRPKPEAEVAAAEAGYRSEADIPENLVGAIQRELTRPEGGYNNAIEFAKTRGVPEDLAGTLVERLNRETTGQPAVKTPTKGPAKAKAPKQTPQQKFEASVEAGNKWTVKEEDGKFIVRNAKGEKKGEYPDADAAYKRAVAGGRGKGKAEPAEAEAPAEAPEGKAPAKKKREPLKVVEKVEDKVGEIDHIPVKSTGFQSYAYKDGVLEVAQSNGKVYRYTGVTADAMKAVSAAVKEGEGVGAALRKATQTGEKGKTIRRPDRPPPKTGPTVDETLRADLEASQDVPAGLKFSEWVEKAKGEKFDKDIAKRLGPEKYKALQEEYSAYKKGEKYEPKVEEPTPEPEPPKKAAAKKTPPKGEGDVGTLSAEEILVDQKVYDAAAEDVLYKKGSKTTGPLEVWKTEDGRFLLVDGQHRFVEGIQKGVREFDVKVVGEGYSDYYATPAKGREFKVPKKKPAKRPGAKGDQGGGAAKLAKAVEEAEGPATTLQQDLAEMRGLLKKAKTAEEKADLKARIAQLQKDIKAEAKQAPAKKAEPAPPAEPARAEPKEGDWFAYEKPNGKWIVARRNKDGSLKTLKKEYRSQSTAGSAAEKRNVAAVAGRAEKVAAEAGARGAKKPAPPAGPQEAPADATMPENPMAVRVAANKKGLAVKAKAGGVWEVVDKGSQKALVSYKGKNAEAAALRYAEAAKGGKEAPIQSPARATTKDSAKVTEGKAPEKGSLEEAEALRDTAVRAMLEAEKALKTAPPNKKPGLKKRLAAAKAVHEKALDLVKKRTPKEEAAPVETPAPAKPPKKAAEKKSGPTDEEVLAYYENLTKDWDPKLGSPEFNVTSKGADGGKLFPEYPEFGVRQTTAALKRLQAQGKVYKRGRAWGLGKEPAKPKVSVETPKKVAQEKASAPVKEVVADLADAKKPLDTKGAKQKLEQARKDGAPEEVVADAEAQVAAVETPTKPVRQSKKAQADKKKGDYGEAIREDYAAGKLSREQATRELEMVYGEKNTARTTLPEPKKADINLPLSNAKGLKIGQKVRTAAGAEKYVHDVDAQGYAIEVGKNPPKKVEQAGLFDADKMTHAQRLARWKASGAENPLTKGLIEAEAPWLKGKVRESGADFVIDTPEGGTLTIRQGGGISLSLKSAREHGYSSLAEAQKAGAHVQGRFVRYDMSPDALIEVTESGILPHELYHAFESAFATAKELRIARAAQAKRAASSGRSLSEEGAIAFERFVRADKKTRYERSKTATGRIHQRMIDFFNRVKDSVYLTEEGLFRAIQRKQTWERKGVHGAKGGMAVESASLGTKDATNAAARSYNDTHKIVSKPQMEKYIDDINSIAAQIHRSRQRLDYHALEGESILRVNGDKRYPRSEDYTTQCRRRYELSDTVDGVQAAVGRMLEADDVLAIRSALELRGHEVSCGPCYVESRRIKMDTAVNKAIEGYTRKRKKSEGGGTEFVKLTKANAERALTQEGRNWMFEHDRAQYDIVSNAFAGLNAKVPIGRSAYKSDYLRLGQETIDAMNSYSGARSQSWSDFEVPHAIDKMQATLDKSLRGLKAHSYTKEIEYVELMKDSGESINMSLIYMKKPDGSIVLNPKQSMRNMKRARQIRERYDNVGFEGVAIEDAHLRALLDNPEIDYVIPYHVSGLSGKHAKMAGVEGWTNYESPKLGYKGIVAEQHWTDLRPKTFKQWATTKGKLKVRDIPEKGTAARKALDKRYKEYKDNFEAQPLEDVSREVFIDEWKGDYDLLWKLSKERGVLPPFLRFKDHPNYYKLLTDRRVFDKNGNFIEQKPVQFKFDMAYVNEMLKKYRGGHDTSHAVPEVVAEFAKGIKARPAKKKPLTAAQKKQRDEVRRLREQGRADKGKS